MNGYTEIRDPRALDTAMACARGIYQRNLLRGTEALSGATLRGTARGYGAHYARSRRNLLERVRAAGVSVGERKGYRGKRILVLG